MLFLYFVRAHLELTIYYILMLQYHLPIRSYRFGLAILGAIVSMLFTAALPLGAAQSDTSYARCRERAQKLFGEYNSQLAAADRPQSRARLNTIGQRLAARSYAPLIKWHFWAIPAPKASDLSSPLLAQYPRNASINVFTLGTGTLLVSTDLADNRLLKLSDDELAGLMAVEMCRDSVNETETWLDTQAQLTDTKKEIIKVSQENGFLRQEIRKLDLDIKDQPTGLATISTGKGTVVLNDMGAINKYQTLLELQKQLNAGQNRYQQLKEEETRLKTEVDKLQKKQSYSAQQQIFLDSAAIQLCSRAGYSPNGLRMALKKLSTLPGNATLTLGNWPLGTRYRREDLYRGAPLSRQLPHN